MKKTMTLAPLLSHFLFCILAVVVVSSCRSKVVDRPAQLVQIGGMHEAIGQQQHQGRISLAELVGKPNFYGVGALAELEGEVTIIDSTPIVTVVGMDGNPIPASASGKEATMLVGQSIQEWKTVTVIGDVSFSDFDKVIAEQASNAGVDVSHPFFFLIDGVFPDVNAHVINGACPIHARMKRLTIENDKLPSELAQESISGTVVGIYASDSVGKLTHPTSSTHAHLVYSDSNEAIQLTAHIERAHIAKGSVLKFPVTIR